MVETVTILSIRLILVYINRVNVLFEEAFRAKIGVQNLLVGRGGWSRSGKTFLNPSRKTGPKLCARSCTWLACAIDEKRYKETINMGISA